jgi:hypothetical protein
MMEEWKGEDDGVNKTVERWRERNERMIQAARDENNGGTKDEHDGGNEKVSVMGVTKSLERRGRKGNDGERNKG